MSTKDLGVTSTTSCVGASFVLPALLHGAWQKTLLLKQVLLLLWQAARGAESGDPGAEVPDCLGVQPEGHQGKAGDLGAVESIGGAAGCVVSFLDVGEEPRGSIDV